MEPARRPPSSSFVYRWPLALLLAAAAAGGCYKPNILEGGFKCNTTAGPGKACPEGFKCNPGTQTCVKTITDGGVDKPDGTDGPVDMMPGPCYDARPNCTPDAGGLCDPYCQTGCGCRQKCSVNSDEALTCEVVAPGPTPALYAYCNFQNFQAPNQTDDCAPGQVCVADNCSQHCYQFCRDDNDCSNAACDREVVDGGQKVCDVPYVNNCVPLVGGMNTGCTGSSTMSCYLSSAHADRTLCDCPAGAGAANSLCKHSRDCNRGLACVDKQDGTPAMCLLVCDRTMDAGVAACNGNAAACHPYYGNPAGPTPNPRYGYCY